MRSASRIVLSRWAITNDVRPSSSSSRFCLTARSDSVSSALVASSKSRIGGLVVERAGDRDPLLLAAGEPQAATRRRACRSRAAAARRTRVRSRPRAAQATRVRVGLASPNAMLRGDRVVEEVVLLQHEADLPAQRAVVERAAGRRRRRGSCPRSARAGPASSLTSVVLPEPLRPTIATVSPGSTSNGDALEDRRRLRAAVAEADVAQLDCARRASSPAAAASGRAPCSGSCSKTSSSRSSRTGACCSSSQSASSTRTGPFASATSALNATNSPSVSVAVDHLRARRRKEQPRARRS